MNTSEQSDSIELNTEEKAALLSAARLADLKMKAWIKQNGGVQLNGEDVVNDSKDDNEGDNSLPQTT